MAGGRRRAAPIRAYLSKAFPAVLCAPDVTADPGCAHEHPDVHQRLRCSPGLSRCGSELSLRRHGALLHPVTALPPMMPRAAQPTGVVLRPIQAGSQLWLPQPVPQSNSLPNLICLPQGQNHNNVTGPSAALVRLQQAHASTLMDWLRPECLGRDNDDDGVDPLPVVEVYAALDAPPAMARPFNILGLRPKNLPESRDTAAAPTTQPIQQALPLTSVRRIT
jgi:hypothetical protein